MRQTTSARNHDRTGGETEARAALYVNYFELGHNPFEFLIDFGQYRPGSGAEDGDTAIHTRIALAPPFAKMLSDLLARSVREHEAEYGSIAEVEAPPDPLEAVLAPLNDFEARARALRAAQVSNDSLDDR